MILKSIIMIQNDKDNQYLGAGWQASSWAAFSAIFCAMPFCRKLSNFALPMYMFETDARNLQNMFIAFSYLNYIISEGKLFVNKQYIEYWPLVTFV